MFCDKCGAPLNDGDAFCGNCGYKVETVIDNSVKEEKEKKEIVFNPYEDVKNDNNDNIEELLDNKLNIETKKEEKQESSESTKAQNVINSSDSPKSNVKTVKLSKKALIITCAVLVVLCAGLIAFYFIWNNMPVEINLSDYVSGKVYNDTVREEFYGAQGDDYEVYDVDDEYYADKAYINYEIGAGLNVYGYNEFATVSEYELYNVIDWNALERDVNDKLSKKKKIGGRHLTFYDFVNGDSFTFSADSFEGLKNDDVVTVSVDSFTSNYGDITVKFSGCSKEYKISDLISVKAFDPFEYVSFVLYGANGYAEARCVIDSELNQNIEGIEGFKVTYYDDRTIAVEKDDYIVSKIDFYLDDNTASSSNLKNGDVATMYCGCSDDLTEPYNLYIANYQKNYSVGNLGEYVTKSSSISNDDISKFKSDASNIINENYGDNDSYADFKFESAYIADLKEKSATSSYHNSFCLIYSYSYVYWDGEKETRYLYVNYEDLILSPDGAIAFTPDIYYDRVSNGYDSAEEILSARFSDRYNVSKIN